MDNTAYRYDSALLPPQWTICGVALKPFCLGHFLILRHLNNPITSEEEMDINASEGIYWLFHALLICALSFEDNVKLYQNEKLLRDVYDKFNRNLVKNMRKEKGWNIFQKHELFKQYIGYFFNIPKFDEKSKSDGVASGIDWVQNLFVTFKKLSYSESEILNMPFRKLFYEWCSEAECQGAIKVWNKHTLMQYGVAKGLIKPPTKRGNI